MIKTTLQVLLYIQILNVWVQHKNNKTDAVVLLIYMIKKKSFEITLKV